LFNYTTYTIRKTIDNDLSAIKAVGNLELVLMMICIQGLCNILVLTIVEEVMILYTYYNV